MQISWTFYIDKIKTYLNSVWLSTSGQILTGHLWCSLKKYWHLSVWVPKVTVWCVTCICVTFSSVSPSLMSLTFIFQKWWTNWDLSLVWCMCEGKLKPWLISVILSCPCRFIKGVTASKMTLCARVNLLSLKETTHKFARDERLKRTFIPWAHHHKSSVKRSRPRRGAPGLRLLALMDVSWPQHHAAWHRHHCTSLTLLFHA